MHATRLLMGMPVTVELVDENAVAEDLAAVFAHFVAVDARFSTYRPESEVSQLNRGELTPAAYSPELREVLDRCATTKAATAGYFDCWHDGQCDPSGLVKGWAIHQAAQLLQARGYEHFVVEAGGDFAVSGLNHDRLWRIGIRNPFDRHEHVKILALTDGGVATSGTAIRGQHIYNPLRPHAPLLEVVSLTVIGPDVYEADRFATAAFAMGRAGIDFIESLPGFAGYQIDADGAAIRTRRFERYVAHR